jgi:hypothetical protein
VKVPGLVVPHLVPLLVPLLGGCAAGPESSAFLLTGWSYGWERQAHRISYLRTRLEPDSSLALGFIGGTFTTGEDGNDTPDYRVRYEKVTTTEAAFATASVEAEVGPDGELDAVAHGSTSGANADLGDWTDTIAFLSGFEIDTDTAQNADYPHDYDPADGYTSNGFGFTAGEPSIGPDGIDVPITGQVRWGPQDREDMNAAIPYATTHVRVDVTVVAYDGTLATADLDRTVDYGEGDPDAPAWVDTDEAPMELDADVSGRGRDGFVGWTSFDLGANLDGPFAGEGDYLRAFGVEAVPDERAPRDWSGSATATLSNTNVIEFTQLTARFRGTLARVGVRSADVSDYVVEGTHPVGRARTGPTVPAK